jgi:hypothetical protein
MSNNLAPDIGTLVEYHGSNYRVDGWIKVATPIPNYKQMLKDGIPPFKEIIASILYETAYNRRGDRFEWSTRENASHLSLSGVAGAIAKIEDCKITGKVSWSEDVIEEYRQQALLFVGELIS